MSGTESGVARGRLWRVCRVFAAGALVVALGFGQPAAGDQPKAPAATVLPEPSGVRVTARPDLAAITWDSPLATTWVVEVVLAGGSAPIRSISTNETIAVASGLQPQTDYQVRVRARDASGAETTSRLVSFTTPATPYPQAPPFPKAEPTSTTSLAVSWNDVPFAASYEISHVEVEAKTDPVVAQTKKRSADLSELKPGKNYDIRVRALDSEGEPISDWSAEPPVTVPEPTPLKVASYNIKCANCKGGASWAKRRGAVANTILGQMPDVIGLQEASQGRMKGRRVSQFVDLLNLLGSPYQVTDRSPGASGAVRIFYNSETVELIAEGAKALPRSGGSNQQRYLSWAIFKQKATGTQFLFGDTHLEPGKQFGSLRKRQAQTIASTLKAVGSDELPTIVVGDLNSYRWMKGGNQPYDVLTRAGFADPLGMTYQSRGQSAPGAFVENRINTRYSSYNDFKRKAPRLGHINGTYLDYILVSPMRVSEWETVVKVDSSGRFVGTIPSDHNLVRATVWLP